MKIKSPSLYVFLTFLLASHSVLAEAGKSIDGGAILLALFSMLCILISTPFFIICLILRFLFGVDVSSRKIHISAIFSFIGTLGIVYANDSNSSHYGSHPERFFYLILLFFPIMMAVTWKNDEEKRIAEILFKKKQWKKMENGFWKSVDGEIAVQTKDSPKDKISSDKHLITEITGEGISLKSIIDPETFIHLQNDVYKDKNHVYLHSGVKGHEKFRIMREITDPLSLSLMGDNYYAKDNQNIYDQWFHVLKNIDYDTFRTEKGCGCYGKDKNGYYFGGKKTNIKEIHPEIREQLLKM